MEIIRLGMNDYRLSDDLSHMEPPGKDSHIGLSMVGQERRQIPRMVRMRRFAGIKMTAGIRESLPVTIVSLMNMECKEASLCLWKSGYLCFNHYAVLSLKESHNSTHRGMLAVPLNPCRSLEKAFSHQSIAPKWILCCISLR